MSIEQIKTTIEHLEEVRQRIIQLQPNKSEDDQHLQRYQKRTKGVARFGRQID